MESKFLASLVNLSVLRDGIDFFAGESDSFLTMDLILNQRVGLERATAATFAIHYHTAKDQLRWTQLVTNVSAFPYPNQQLRAPAKSLHNLLKEVIHSNTTLAELSVGATGALASLERYYNRKNKFFAPILQTEVSAKQIYKIDMEQFKQITQLNFPSENLQKQLTSVAKIIEMKREGKFPSRKELLELDRVGEETADTLLVYLFKQPAIIADDYLYRILYRHFVIEKNKIPRKHLESLLSKHITDHDLAHRLHARINEIGTLFCFASKPNCNECPLGNLPVRLT